MLATRRSGGASETKPSHETSPHDGERNFPVYYRYQIVPFQIVVVVVVLVVISRCRHAILQPLFHLIGLNLNVRRQRRKSI